MAGRTVADAGKEVVESEGPDHSENWRSDLDSHLIEARLTADEPQPARHLFKPRIGPWWKALRRIYYFAKRIAKSVVELDRAEAA